MEGNNQQRKNNVRYTIEQYDTHGYLKAPTWLWLGWLFLARAWIVFVVAGVSRDSGSQILSFVYPGNAALYIGLVAGVPGIALMWLISLRHPERRWINALFRTGRWLTLLTASVQFIQTGYHVYLQHGAFHWANALTLLILLWLVLYVYRSRSVRDCFLSPLMAKP